MDLASRIRERRERLSLTQERVARAIGVPRELVSNWENGVRPPSLRQLQGLATVLNSSAAQLLGESSDADEERHVMLRGVEDDDVRLELRRWLDFLDSWADFLEDLGQDIAGPGSPPRRLDEGVMVTDARKAPTLAQKVRDYYQLGADAMPDLYAFLDERGYLVSKASLGSIGQGHDGISGAFYNHPRIGFCILVNTDTSPGRQAFSLAHEFAHSLYHHSKAGIICRYDPNDPIERFANAFAANFLVPGKELRRMVKADGAARVEVAPSKALSLAVYFGVSYAMILVRLKSEGLITSSQHEEWGKYSPKALAHQIGLAGHEFHIPDPRQLRLDRHAVSVLELVRSSIERDLLSPKQAAGLLGVDVREIQQVLLAKPPPATELELREHEQFAHG